MLSTPHDAFEALKRIVEATIGDVRARGADTVPLQESVGRTVADDIHADRDQPPFPRASMDGIAVRSASAVAAGSTFRLVGELAAGGDPAALTATSDTETDADWSDGRECIEIMTGAAVPDGYARVIPFEVISKAVIDGGTVYTVPEGIEGKTNIHPRGVDYRKGALLIRRGTRITAPHVAVLASCGYAGVPVVPRPSIAVIGTGDEIVPPEQNPLSYQIRGSNPWTISGELEAWGFPCDEIALVRDDRNEVTETISRMVEGHDIVLVSGAVSKGTYDFVPDILTALGAHISIHGVRQRPGKPLLIGEAGGRTIMGLPGNPVSSLVAIRRYLVPLLTASYGRSDAGGYTVITGEDIDFEPPLTWFPAVDTVRSDDGRLVATIREGHGSGDFYHIAGSSGFIEVPEDSRRMAAGSAVTFFPWGS